MQNCIADGICGGATWVALQNGDGVGWGGEVTNGALVLYSIVGSMLTMRITQGNENTYDTISRAETPPNRRGYLRWVTLREIRFTINNQIKRD